VTGIWRFGVEVEGVGDAATRLGVVRKQGWAPLRSVEIRWLQLGQVGVDGARAMVQPAGDRAVDEVGGDRVGLRVGDEGGHDSGDGLLVQVDLCDGSLA